jgi:tetratricopeptide (TPR) repeat protein
MLRGYDALLPALANPPSRVFAAMFTFGSLLGVPFLVGAMGAVLAATGSDIGWIFVLLAVVILIVATIVIWVLLLGSKSKLRSAEGAIYQGDFASAVRTARFVLWTTFRSDVQLVALFVLGLVAERIGAFREAAEIFRRALDMVPAFAAASPRRRIRALISAHAAMDYAATGDRIRANDMIQRCYRELGTNPYGGFDFFRMDDSAFGAIGVNAALNEIEQRRDPRPLAVLAAALVAYRNGDARAAYDLVMHERQSIEHGLAPNERALADMLANVQVASPFGEWASTALTTVR